MQKNLTYEFKSLLSKDEYLKLMEKFKGNKIDVQTNHYFDTKRFTLKAVEASLRVRERETFELTFKKKKGYTMQEFNSPITKEIMEEIKETGYLPEGDWTDEVKSLIGEQKVQNFLSLSTERLYLPYKNGVLFIDKSTYLGEVDYEIEYEAKTLHDGKKEFIELIKELGFQYRKADKKIKRAYAAYKKGCF